MRSKSALAVLGTAALAVPILWAVAATQQIPAQSASSVNASLPSFEVASVRRSDPRENTSLHIEPNRFRATNYEVAYLIEWAYGRDLGDYGLMQLRYSQLVGGPEWMRGGEFGYEGYDIDAKVDDALAEKFGTDCGRAFFRGRCAYRQQMILMLQSLFADRFKLKVHRETKEGPVYALVVAKGGPKFPTSLPPDSQARAENSVLPPPKHPPCPPGWLCLREYTSMTRLADWFSADPQVGRTVIDQTGLKGLCYIELRFAREQGQTEGGTGSESSSLGIGTAPPLGPAGPSLFTALQDQLGLKLKPTKGPVETLVIEHIERPTEN